MGIKFLEDCWCTSYWHNPRRYVHGVEIGIILNDTWTAFYRFWRQMRVHFSNWWKLKEDCWCKIHTIMRMGRAGAGLGWAECRNFSYFWGQMAMRFSTWWQFVEDCWCTLYWHNPRRYVHGVEIGIILKDTWTAFYRFWRQMAIHFLTWWKFIEDCWCKIHTIMSMGRAGLGYAD